MSSKRTAKHPAPARSPAHFAAQVPVPLPGDRVGHVEGAAGRAVGADGGDLGKRDCKVCIRVPGSGTRRHLEMRTFTTTTNGLLELRDYLIASRITVFGMEATGS